MGVKFQFTRRQWYILAILGTANFTSALCVSLQAPFFPREAELKGSTATEYGFVFGVYQLVAFFICPIYGKYVNQIGGKFVLICGMLLAGSSIIGFGLLDLIDSHVPFIAMAFVMRILESLGTSAAIISSYSMTGVIFHDSIATSFAVLKMLFSFGVMLGPTLGGYLYQIAGYSCPFLVVGCTLVMEAVLVFFLLPSIKDHRDLGVSKVRMCTVLKLFPVWLDLFGTTALAMVIGFLNATLEPHIRQFHLTPVTIGVIFMIGNAIYAPLAPLVGYLCDTRVYPKKVIMCGGLLLFVGISLIGPAPFIPMETTLWLVCLGLAFNGLGYACIMVPTILDAVQTSVARGIPNNTALYGVVSGLAQSAFALGDCIGPSIGGLLLDLTGFRNSTILLLTMQATLLVAMTGYVCTEKRATEKPDDVEPHSIEPAQASVATKEDQHSEKISRPPEYVH